MSDDYQKVHTDNRYEFDVHNILLLYTKLVDFDRNKCNYLYDNFAFGKKKHCKFLI